MPSFLRGSGGIDVFGSLPDIHVATAMPCHGPDHGGKHRCGVRDVLGGHRVQNPKTETQTNPPLIEECCRPQGCWRTRTALSLA